MVKRGDGTSQGTGLNDSCTQSREWRVTVGERDGLGGRGQKGENWDNYNKQ